MMISLWVLGIIIVVSVGFTLFGAVLAILFNKADEEEEKI
jgi:hypothetical protein